MAEEKIKVRGVYRSGSHLPIWTVMKEAGIWEQAGLELAGFVYCAPPPAAEKALFNPYELGCIKNPEAKQLSPLALWDLHYLRQLDNSGFIDGIYGRP